MLTLCLCAGCATTPPAAVTEPAAPAASSASPPAPIAAPSSAPAAAASSAPPPERKYTEEEQFWLDLAFTFNESLPICRTGWTGDGRITVKGGKIAAFDLVEHGLKGDVATPVPSLRGKKIPPIPPALRQVFDAPVPVSVCVGSTRIWQNGAP